MYKVEWNIPFSQSTDFLSPLQRGGIEKFKTKKDAIAFIKKIREEGVPNWHVLSGEIKTNSPEKCE